MKLLLIGHGYLRREAARVFRMVGWEVATASLAGGEDSLACNVSALDQPNPFTTTLDEGQPITNPDAKTAKRARELDSQNHLYWHCLIGTVIEHWQVGGNSLPSVLVSVGANEPATHFPGTSQRLRNSRCSW